LASITSTQSATSLINTNQPGSPSAHSAMSMPISSHPVIDQSLSAPLTNRKANLLDDSNNSQRHHHLIFNTSQSKEAPSRGISPRINRHTPATTTTSNTYHPSSIEKL
jgi:hypothetical protein